MCGLLAYQGNVNHLVNFETEFKKLGHRGPDDTKIYRSDEASLCFHRLSIMDTSSHGHQPFHDQVHQTHLICNGEIYNHHELRKKYESEYAFISHSDCEVILPLYHELGIEKMARSLDAEFALVVYDEKSKKLLAARDPIGIRPLFYGFDRKYKKILFASEAKVLIPFVDEVIPFPPGHYYDGNGNFISYRKISTEAKPNTDSMDVILKNIREKLIEGVRKRLEADVPVGFLLSGGLDSSLVCGIAHKILKKKLTTFSVGLDHNPIDIKYAKIVADFIQSDHHEVYFNKQDTLDAIKPVIWHLETWDITTIRASIGMYLVCKYIKEKTKIKVILTGEISDELFGYKYTDFAPNGDEFQKESVKRIDELYLYDVLRADRCIAAHSLEARVPFGDLDFVNYVMSIPGNLKMNTHNMGKFLLREAFKDMNLIPDEILWREKAAFSDAVGHSMVDYLKEAAETLYQSIDNHYTHGKPFTKESLMYRDLFENDFKAQGKLIKDFWLPNKEWENCNVLDPSARVLPNYGASGK